MYDLRIWNIHRVLCGTYICEIIGYVISTEYCVAPTVGTKKNFTLRSGTTYFYFLSVTFGGVFPTFFLSVLRKRTVGRKRTILSD